MRICVEKATNKIIEMQSEATEGTLIANAVAAGYAKKDIEEKEVTPVQYETAMSIDPVSINMDAARLAAIAKGAQKQIDIETNLKTWKVLSDDIAAANDVKELKDIVLRLARVVYWLGKDEEL